MELEKVIQEKVNGLVTTGAVDKIIEAHIAKCIDKLLDDMLSTYSDFGKQVKEAIGQKLQLNLTNLNIDCYSAMVLRTIEDTLRGSVTDKLATKVKNNVSEVLKLIEKKHWKLSEIVHTYREGLYGDNPKVDLEYKEETYGNYIQLGERGSASFGASRKQHDITIHLNKKDKNRVFAVTNHGKHLNPLSDNPRSWEVFLMQLWVNDCTVEIDEDEAQAIAEREENY
jgi:hypothetical protein